jgi:hypothetical protein
MLATSARPQIAVINCLIYEEFQGLFSAANTVVLNLGESQPLICWQQQYQQHWQQGSVPCTLLLLLDKHKCKVTTNTMGLGVETGWPSATAAVGSTEPHACGLLRMCRIVH